MVKRVYDAEPQRLYALVMNSAEVLSRPKIVRTAAKFQHDILDEEIESYLATSSKTTGGKLGIRC